MKLIKTRYASADQLQQLQDRGLQGDNLADHPGQAMNANAVVMAKGNFLC